MKIISHRGGSKLAPENSIEAIKLSRSLGVDSAEIDIHITKDNKLVVFHDYSLKRMAGIDKPINTLTLKEINAITLLNGATIPTLSEIIDAAGDMKLTIEGKGGSWARLLTKELSRHHFKNKPNFISFNDAELKKFKNLNEDAECYTIDIFKALKSIKTARKNGFSGIDIHYLALNRFVYKTAKKNNMKIIVWTLNSTSRAKKLAKRYPDISITTDIPDKMIKEL